MEETQKEEIRKDGYVLVWVSLEGFWPIGCIDTMDWELATIEEIRQIITKKSEEADIKSHGSNP